MKKIILFISLISLNCTAQEIGVNYGTSIDGTFSVRFLKHINAGVGVSVESDYTLPNIFLEYSKTFNKKHEIYGGVNYGQFYTSHNNIYKAGNYSNEFGAQIGYSYRIVKGLTANAELYNRYISLDRSKEYIDLENKTNSLLYRGVTIGIHYKFAK